MNKLFLLLFVFVLVGCDSSVKNLKNHVFEVDKAITFGDAVAFYPNFSHASWTKLSTAEGKSVINVVGVLSNNARFKIKGLPAESSVIKARLTLQFMVNLDNTFELIWCGMNYTLDDNSTYSTEKISQLNCAKSLYSIYTKDELIFDNIKAYSAFDFIGK